MQGDLPASSELALVGGGARSDFWAQLLASSLGCSLRRSSVRALYPALEREFAATARIDS